MKQQRKARQCLSLFRYMLMISAFTFGGGFVIVSLMKKKFVDEKQWLSEQEMLDMTALAQSCPGAIAVNAAILVGWRLCGFAGCLCAVLGTVIPPVVTLSVISLFYNAFSNSPPVAALLRGMQAGVAAVIADVTWNLGSRVVCEKSIWPIIIMLSAFLAAFVWQVNVVIIILGAAGIGILRFLITERRRRA